MSKATDMSVKEAKTKWMDIPGDSRQHYLVRMEYIPATEKLLVQQLNWTSAQFVSSECEETTCNARFLVGFTVYAAVPGVKSFNGTRNIDESWVLVDGNWDFVPKR